jgi:hypothetical protein
METHTPGPGALSSLVYRRKARTRRASSWQTTGGNRDRWTIPPGETRTLADIPGSGCIRHIWITVGTKDKMYLRNMELRAYWNGEKDPSILSPLGDFFCLGHGIARSFASLPFACVTEEANEGEFGGGIAMNCYFAMPFRNGAKIEIVNRGDVEATYFYFYIDYEECEVPEDALLFHAHYRQETPTRSDKGDLSAKGENYWDHMDEPNLDNKGNYVFLDAKGAGHFVGCNISVHNIDPMVSKKKVGAKEVDVFDLTWWGEGDDMFFIDGEGWPPSLHGTGSEDYFSQAWGMHDKAFPYSGTSIYENDPKHPGRHMCTSYRFHIEDPIHFEKSLHASIEHGHANLQENDYSSVAYWYQTQRTAPLPELPAAPDRLPRTHRS